MKNLIEYIITESNANEIIFNACMELDNNEQIYKSQYYPLVKNLTKIHAKGEFEISKLENSQSVSKLATKVLKATNASLSSNERKRLYKFIVGCLLKNISNEGEDLTKEEEDYMIEWDYNNSEKCGW